MQVEEIHRGHLQGLQRCAELLLDIGSRQTSRGGRKRLCVDLEVLCPDGPEDLLSVAITVKTSGVQNGVAVRAIGRKQLADFIEVGHSGNGAGGDLPPGLAESHGAENGDDFLGSLHDCRQVLERVGEEGGERFCKFSSFFLL